ncbi:hypothetical protein PCASD_08483 [Puccinia coronata f. sp. avenae]|uniref:Uncharacterized protein n=1 Tax=Puccinia coronata f. sp. avenae TaxID=200324 RepID=A0A2N5UY76_9BASI|nr:hypothetical protein PCASD_08483 [Puccinia coronata f. sp. avenae]
MDAELTSSHNFIRFDGVIRKSLAPPRVHTEKLKPERAVKLVEILTICDTSFEIKWIPASAYSAEDKMTRLVDSWSYFICGHLFMDGCIPRPRLRFDLAAPFPLTNTSRGPPMSYVTGYRSIIQLTNLQMDDGKGNVFSIIVKHVNFVSKSFISIM